ncbi:MAG: DegV family protein [Bacillota bacterium]|nr:MAG: DegV family protein [Bacillota bacterium]
MKIAILTDSGSNLSSDFVKQHANLFVIPLMIVIDGKNYRDQIEISAEEVYEKLDTHQVTTSLPSNDDLTALLENIKKKGFTDVLAINISSGLSGTFNAFRLAFQEVKDLKITHYDSKTLGGGLAFLVQDAISYVDKNMAIPDIIKQLDRIRYEDSLAIYTINTLKYLKKGGRIGKVEGTIGDILHIKPVITVNEEGVYITLSKGFGLQRSLLKMKDLLVEKFGGSKIDLIVHYGNDLEKANELADRLKKDLDIRNIVLSPLTPVLGIHTGPQMFAFVANKVK